MIQAPASVHWNVCFFNCYFILLTECVCVLFRHAHFCSSVQHSRSTCTGKFLDSKQCQGGWLRILTVWGGEKSYFLRKFPVLHSQGSLVTLIALWSLRMPMNNFCFWYSFNSNHRFFSSHKSVCCHLQLLLHPAASDLGLTLYTALYCCWPVTLC